MNPAGFKAILNVAKRWRSNCRRQVVRLYLAEKVTARRFYQQHLKSSGELVTTYEAVHAGFVELATEKNRRATPLVAQARALKSAAALAKSPA